MVAYQPGKAANMAAPATTSHTSLPSHSGPMVSTAASLPGSSPPTGPCRMPTPKSKPSRTKKPAQSTVITMNQNSASVTCVPSRQMALCLVAEHRGLLLGGLLRRRRLLVGRRPQRLARVAQHQHHVHHREPAVE